MSAVVTTTPGRLEVDTVGKRYANRFTSEVVTALADLSFMVEPGEVVTLVGPSGCGKSTFLKLVAGLIPATSGQILVDGHPVRGPGADRGMVFQEYALFPWMTVLDNVGFGLRMRRVGKPERHARAHAALELVNLSELAGRYPRELSGGQRQRVAVARALANEPRVVLMDEPFAAVDALTRQQLQESLDDILHAAPSTVVFVTHSVEEAVFLGDRVLVFAPGPGPIRATHTVGLPRPRRWEQVRDLPEFAALQRDIAEHLGVVHR